MVAARASDPRRGGRRWTSCAPRAGSRSTSSLRKHGLPRERGRGRGAGLPGPPPRARLSLSGSTRRGGCAPTSRPPSPTTWSTCTSTGTAARSEAAARGRCRSTTSRRSCLGGALIDPAAAYQSEPGPWPLSRGARRCGGRELAAGANGAGRSRSLRELFRCGETPPYPELAAKHGMTVPQLKSFVHRARRRSAQLLLARVTDTVQTPDEAEAELGELLRALGA